MAARKAPHTAAQASPQDGAMIPDPPASRAMPEGHFASAVRQVMQGRGVAKQLLDFLPAEMERLGIPPSAKARARFCPKGSDQTDVRSLIDWACKVQPGDEEAAKQMQTLHATALTVAATPPA